MANTALVSFKLPPEHYTILVAIAEGRDTTVSELVRETVTGALELPAHAERIASLFSPPNRKSELEYSEA